jgi:hypothetical protein
MAAQSSSGSRRASDCIEAARARRARPHPLVGGRTRMVHPYHPCQGTCWRCFSFSRWFFPRTHPHTRRPNGAATRNSMKCRSRVRPLQDSRWCRSGLKNRRRLRRAVPLCTRPHTTWSPRSARTRRRPSSHRPRRLFDIWSRTPSACARVCAAQQLANFTNSGNDVAAAAHAQAASASTPASASRAAAKLPKLAVFTAVCTAQSRAPNAHARACMQLQGARWPGSAVCCRTAHQRTTRASSREWHRACSCTTYRALTQNGWRAAAAPGTLQRVGRALTAAGRRPWCARAARRPGCVCSSLPARRTANMPWAVRAACALQVSDA